MNDLHYLISSTNKYYMITLPVILKSMIRVGIQPDKIVVVIGDSVNKHINKMSNILVIYDNNNSYDYTGLISLINNNLIRDNNYFLLHDTCEVNDKFKQESINMNNMVNDFLAVDKIGLTGMGVITNDTIIKLSKCPNVLMFQRPNIKVSRH